MWARELIHILRLQRNRKRGNEQRKFFIHFIHIHRSIPFIRSHLWIGFFLSEIQVINIYEMIWMDFESLTFAILALRLSEIWLFDIFMETIQFYLWINRIQNSESLIFIFVTEILLEKFSKNMEKCSFIEITQLTEYEHLSLSVKLKVPTWS